MKEKLIIGTTYFSLPEFPKDCELIDNRDLLLRDLLVCNKNNFTHFKSGGQYDPHIESHPPEYRFCHRTARKMVYNKKKEFDDFYLLLWTNYLRLDSTNEHRLVGYYKINKEYLNDDNYILYAEEIKFVNLKDTVDISSFLKDYNLYRVCPSNINSKYGKKLEKLKSELDKKSKENKSIEYVKQTKRIKKIFNKSETQKNYTICNDCSYFIDKNKYCPLIWRIYHSGWSDTGYCELDTINKCNC